MFRFAARVALSTLAVFGVLTPLALVAQAQGDLGPAGDLMDPVLWYHYVCGDAGANLKWLVGVLGTSFVAGLLGNIRKMLPRTILLGFDLLAGNVVQFLRRRSGALAVLAAILTGPVYLDACTTAQLQQAQTDVGVALADAESACTLYAPVSAALAAAPAGSSAAITKGYIDGGCNIATGHLTPAGLSAVTKDPATAAWITAGTAALTAIATVGAPPPASPAEPAASAAGPGK